MLTTTTINRVFSILQSASVRVTSNVAVVDMGANLQTPAYTTAFGAQLVFIPFCSQSLLIDTCELLCFNHG